MTFNGILADCYRRLRYQAAPAAAVQTRIKAFVNEVHRELLGLPGLIRLRDDQIAISTTANSPYTALPKAVGRIKLITDHTNSREIIHVSLQELRAIDPGRVLSNSYPERYAEVGWRQVASQPAAATGVWVVSSAAGDTTQTAWIEGVRTGGALATASVVLNGTTRAQVGALTDFIEITQFYVSATVVGTISLYDAAAAGNDLADIAPSETYARYLTIEYQPVPSTTMTLYCDYERNVLDLVNDGAMLLIPDDFAWVLAEGVRLKEYEFLDDTRAQTVRPEYERGKSALRTWVLGSGDQLSALRLQRRRFSNLGPMYPANSVY